MFNIGAGELVAILGLALIVLGPQRLPEAVRTVGRVVGELRRISSGFQDELRNALDDSEVERDLDRLRSSSERDALPATDTTDTTDTTAVEEPSDVVVTDEENGHDLDDGKDPEIDDEAEEPLVGEGIVDVTVDYAVEQGLDPEDNGATPPEASDDDERAHS